MALGVGVGVALLVSLFARVSGFDRDRAFYPTVTVVVASVYVLFAVMGGSAQALFVELMVMMLFVSMAVVGFKRNLWLVAAALAVTACSILSTVTWWPTRGFPFGGRPFAWPTT